MHSLPSPYTKNPSWFKKKSTICLTVPEIAKQMGLILLGHRVIILIALQKLFLFWF